MDCARSKIILNIALLPVFLLFLLGVFIFRPASAHNTTQACTKQGCLDSAASANNSTQACTNQDCLNSATVLKKSINPQVDPCDNFYQYACGNWRRTHPSITEFLPSSSIEERKYRHRNELTRFLRLENKEGEPAAVHKARKLFSLCTDTDSIDQKGLEPIKNILNKTGLSLSPSKDFDLIASSVKVSKLVGVDIFFSVGITPDPYNQTRNRITVDTPPSAELARIPSITCQQRPKRNTYSTLSRREYIQLILKVLSENDTSTEDFLNSTNALTKVIAYTSHLSEATTKQYPRTTPGAFPDIHTLEELQNITDKLALKNNRTPAVNWTYTLQLFFNDVENVTLDFSKPEEIQLVYQELSIKDILDFLYTYSSEDHKIGMTWTVADNLAFYSSYQLRNLKANYSYDITDVDNRFSWCTDAVSQILGMAVSYYYTTDPKYTKIKNEVTEIVDNIHAVFREIVASATWIDDETKKQALKKVDYMKKLVAFPSSLAKKEDLEQYYYDLEVTDDFLESVLIIARKSQFEELNTLNTINDLNEDRRILTPVQVNAFYDPDRNTIIIPAGLLGYPLFEHGLKTLDYGSIGTVIGHEITHGFDSGGRRYNYLGNLEEWWGNQTLEKFTNRTSCFVNVYQNYSVFRDEVLVTTDSLLTLTENIADNGGFKEALRAYKQYVAKNGEEPALPGFENWNHEQLFTLGFANFWCEHSTTLSSLIASTSDHSPNEIRVNGVAANSEDFARIWNCTKGTKMNPNMEKCELW